MCLAACHEIQVFPFFVVFADQLVTARNEVVEVFSTPLTVCFVLWPALVVFTEYEKSFRRKLFSGLLIVACVGQVNVEGIIDVVTTTYVQGDLVDTPRIDSFGELRLDDVGILLPVFVRLHIHIRDVTVEAFAHEVRLFEK